MSLETLRQSASSDYENLAWELVDSLDSLDPASGSVLYAAGKTLEDLCADVAAIKKRIELQGEIARSLDALEARARSARENQELEAELTRAVAEHEARIAALDVEAQDTQEILESTLPAERHYRESAPEWLRELCAEVAEREDSVRQELRGATCNPPSQPSRNGLVSRMPGDAADYAAYRKRVDERFAEDQRVHEASVSELEELAVTLARQRADLEKKIMTLRPQR